MELAARRRSWRRRSWRRRSCSGSGAGGSGAGGSGAAAEAELAEAALAVIQPLGFSGAGGAIQHLTSSDLAAQHHGRIAESSVGSRDLLDLALDAVQLVAQSQRDDRFGVQSDRARAAYMLFAVVERQDPAAQGGLLERRGDRTSFVVFGIRKEECTFYSVFELVRIQSRSDIPIPRLRAKNRATFRAEVCLGWYIWNSNHPLLFY